MKYKKNDEIYINENKMVELIFFLYMFNEIVSIRLIIFFL
jgi:hypothetical protein